VRTSAALSESQRARLLARLDARLTRRGDLIVHSGRFRSRARNREYAREKVAELVREALSTSRPRIPTKASGASRQRSQQAKQRRSAIKSTRARVRPGSEE